MWIEELAPERFSEFVRHCHSALEAFGKAGESGSWEDLADPGRNHLIAAARLIVLKLDRSKNERKSRRYFADPGKAEWGC